MKKILLLVSVLPLGILLNGCDNRTTAPVIPAASTSTAERKMSMDDGVGYEGN